MKNARQFNYVIAALLTALFPHALPVVRERLQRTVGAGESQVMYDVVIRNGRVVDPESRLEAIRNVGVTAGVIRAISTKPLEGRVVIDATGLVVAPGFIDTDGFPENGSFAL